MAMLGAKQDYYDDTQDAIQAICKELRLSYEQGFHSMVRMTREDLVRLTLFLDDVRAHLLRRQS
jgi:hypothetical protein